MHGKAIPDEPAKPQVPLRELALVFLKLGTIAFGGPAAHLAMMEEEFVRKRGWITQADFLDRLAAANLIPGPSSTEVAIFIGQSLRGWTGLIVAGVCFIIPAAVLVSFIAAGYVRYGALPRVAGILAAIKPAVIAIILQALWKLAPSAAKTKTLAAIGVVAAVLSFLGVGPLIVLAFAGAASGIVFWAKLANRGPAAAIFPAWKGAWMVGIAMGGVAVVPVTASRLFLSFLKIGSAVFGSGYVLLAFLRAEFVDRLHWLTEKQLIDAVAVGQFTPGPLFTTATFIGYVVAGVRWGNCGDGGNFSSRIFVGGAQRAVIAEDPAVGGGGRDPGWGCSWVAGLNGRRGVATGAGGGDELVHNGDFFGERGCGCAVSCQLGVGGGGGGGVGVGGTKMVRVEWGGSADRDFCDKSE